MAAQLHVKAAIAGDVVSMGNLIEYRKAIEKHALNWREPTESAAKRSIHI
jgi:hypothetical protein